MTLIQVQGPSIHGQLEPADNTDLAPGTQDWWRERLLVRLALQSIPVAELATYYDGTQELPVVQRKYSAVYERLLGMARNPWARLIVDAIAERLAIQGVRLGDDDANAQAWTLLQANSIDADQQRVYADSLIAGWSYVSAWPDDTLDVGIRIEPETALEVTHENTAGRRREVAAALKLYADTLFGVWRCELYQPASWSAWVAPLDGDSPLDLALETGNGMAQWEVVVDEAANPFGVVPFVPFENAPTVYGGGYSELADLIPVLRRVDKLWLDTMLAAEFGAFRQRWATGIEVPTDPTTGEKVEPYNAAVNRLWVSEDHESKFGSFEATDLGSYLKAIDANIAELAAISRVPAHYLMQQNLANPPSAESLVAAEAGLVAKVLERQRQFGEAWKQVLRIAGIVTGLAVPDQAEVVWRTPSYRNPAQVADAAVKWQSVGVPQVAVWEMLGATPTEIERWLQLSAAEAFAQALALPQAPTAPALAAGV